MKIRAILVFIASLLDEAVVIGFLFWVLPRLGIEIPLAGLVVILVALSVYAVVSYRLIMRALQRKPVVGLSSMVDAQGKAVTALAPEGTIRIKGELWQAVSATGAIEAGAEVTVVAQDGLKLTVRRVSLET